MRQASEFQVSIGEVDPSLQGSDGLILNICTGAGRPGDRRVRGERERGEWE